MKRIKFGKYAGVRIDGTVPMDIVSLADTHLAKASWLTAQVESGGKFGTVINYDGTGMTAGIHQAIAVYPRALDDRIKTNDQGPLWKLLNRIWALPDTSRLVSVREPFIKFMTDCGMLLSPEGKCIDSTSGKLISGKKIRELFSGSASGLMPPSGPGKLRAEQWAFLFHHLFSCPDTFKTQLRFGEEHFIKRSERTKLRFCTSAVLKDTTIREACYDYSMANISSEDITPELDLAMCVFWSHSVNAPGMALKKLCRSLDLAKGEQFKGDFPRFLLKVLANTKYGRWHRTIKGGRWARTRKYAQTVWPAYLFTGPSAIMPA